MQLPFAEAMRVRSLRLLVLASPAQIGEETSLRSNCFYQPSNQAFVLRLSVPPGQTDANLLPERMRIARVIISLPSRITPRRSSLLPFEDRSSLLEYTSWSCLMSRDP